MCWGLQWLWYYDSQYQGLGAVPASGARTGTKGLFKADAGEFQFLISPFSSAC